MMVKKTIQNLSHIAKEKIRYGFNSLKALEYQEEIEISRRLNNINKIVRSQIHSIFNKWQRNSAISSSLISKNSLIQIEKTNNMRKTIKNLQHIAKLPIRSAFSSWKQSVLLDSEEVYEEIIRKMITKQRTPQKNNESMDKTVNFLTKIHKSRDKLTETALFRWVDMASRQDRKEKDLVKSNISLFSYSAMSKVTISPLEDYNDKLISSQSYQVSAKPAVPLTEKCQKYQTAYNPLTRILSIPIIQYETKRSVRVMDNKPLTCIEMLDQTRENTKINRSVLSLDWEQIVLSKIMKSKDDVLQGFKKPLLVPSSSFELQPIPISLSRAKPKRPALRSSKRPISPKSESETFTENILITPVVPPHFINENHVTGTLRVLETTYKPTRLKSEEMIEVTAFKKTKKEYSETESSILHEEVVDRQGEDTITSCLKI